MNDLNSVLMEGTVKSISTGLTSKDRLNFIIESKRYCKKVEEIETETSDFDIAVYGQLATTCFEHLDEGRGVRVVGRLEQEHGGIIIVAEHVEFKPKV